MHSAFVSLTDTETSRCHYWGSSRAKSSIDNLAKNILTFFSKNPKNAVVKLPESSEVYITTPGKRGSADLDTIVL